jgi:hypothetical protein
MELNWIPVWFSELEFMFLRIRPVPFLLWNQNQNQNHFNVFFFELEPVKYHSLFSGLASCCRIIILFWNIDFNAQIYIFEFLTKLH